MMGTYIWVVMDQSAKHHAPIYCAGWPEACQEHINDALDMGLEDAANWVVRRFLSSPEGGAAVTE